MPQGIGDATDDFRGAHVSEEMDQEDGEGHGAGTEMNRHRFYDQGIDRAGAQKTKRKWRGPGGPWSGWPGQDGLGGEYGQEGRWYGEEYRAA